MEFTEFKINFQKKEVEEIGCTSLEKPLVSVCIQTYQHVNFIKQCLEGILSQKTNFPFEILLGEDESSDGTRELCLEFARKYPEKIRLFLHHRENNIRIQNVPTGRFNFIYNLNSARGKYIALCEGDDYWTDPLKLQKQVNFLEANPDYGLCFHPVKILDQSNHQLKEENNTLKVSGTTSITDLAWGNFINTASSLFRNNFEVPDWFVKSFLGDWTLYMIQLKNGKIKRLDDVMAVYRVHDMSILASRNIKEIRKMSKESVRVVLENAELPADIRKILFRRLNRNKMSRLKLELNWLLHTLTANFKRRQ